MAAGHLITAAAAVDLQSCEVVFSLEYSLLGLNSVSNVPRNNGTKIPIMTAAAAITAPVVMAVLSFMFVVPSR